MQPAVTAVRRGDAEDSDSKAQNSAVKAPEAAIVVSEADFEKRLAYGELARLGMKASAPISSCVCCA